MTVAEAASHASSLTTPDDRTSHLRRLEAESIHILRETAESFENPVLLYSIGRGRRFRRMPEDFTENSRGSRRPKN
ncbi:MAG TPA: hypothetical protein VGN57_23085 [Pirellulaceae bacterium]|jgi:hypothetical protein|nr:hypothetical protein [Pirellulaceae bacterium]